MNSKVQNSTRPSKNILKYTLYFNILFRIHFSHQGKQFSTYSAREYFEKLTLKSKTKQKNNNFKRLYLGYILHVLLTWGTRRRAAPPTASGAATSGSQRSKS